MAKKGKASAKKPAKAKRSGELSEKDVDGVSGGDTSILANPTFSNVLTSGLPGGTGGGSSPSESLSLNFTKITTPYKPQ
jgi:hypothetical protein